MWNTRKCTAMAVLGVALVAAAGTPASAQWLGLGGPHSGYAGYSGGCGAYNYAPAYGYAGGCGGNGVYGHAPAYAGVYSYGWPYGSFGDCGGYGYAGGLCR
jgi:hypothetical protein